MISPLTETTLERCQPCATIFGYDRSSVKIGILHIGVGNFHRAHQAVYCDDLLKLGEMDWGITGVSLRSPETRDRLKPQEYLYTVATLGDETSYRIIGALKDIVVAPKELDKFFGSFLSDSLQVVTVTVTEKGYCAKDDQLDTANPQYAADLSGQPKPATVYGFIAAGLLARMTIGNAPITIVSCDNISGGGELLRSGVHQILEQRSDTAVAWVKQNVSFASSVVDRVVPATDADLVQRVKADCKVEDNWPVPAEPFSQWFIEDKFAGDRPPFERVGVQFVKDVQPYARMKLRLLNATHTIAASIGYLLGKDYIHEVMADIPARMVIEDVLMSTILPVTPIPETVNGSRYAESVLARFANPHLSYRVGQVATDSSQKMSVRVFPTIDRLIGSSASLEMISKVVAMWLEYIRCASLASELNDPSAEEFSKIIWGVKSYNALAREVLEIAGAGRFSFFSHNEFMTLVVANWDYIASEGFHKFIQRKEIK